MILGGIAAILLFSWVQADLAVFCEHNSDENLKRSGGFKEYSECIGNVCTCYAYELLCLQRQNEDGAITLESVSYDFAESCPITKCLCNLAGTAAWETTK